MIMHVIIADLTIILCTCVLQVLDLAANIFKQIPENVDYEGTAKILSLDPSPLNVVLLQEVQSVCVFVCFVCVCVCVCVHLCVCNGVGCY